MNGPRAEERKKKAEFILANFPNIKEINPLFAYKEVKEIRMKMIEAGLYARRQSMDLIDSSIINTIKYIQNGKIFQKRYTVRSSKD